MASKKSGFDKTLAFNFRWKNALPELISEIKKSIRREFTERTGQFARSWKLSDLHVRKSGRQETLEITNEHPAARIHEFGRRVPDRVPRRAEALRWMANGEAVYAKRARGFTLRPRGYVQKAIDRWGGRGIDVDWKE